jgi:fluoroacetyl-CoA thioesterase
VATVAEALEARRPRSGSQVELDHLDPSLDGAELEVEAVLERIDGRRLVFAVHLAAGDRVVARGRVTRVVVDKAAFLRQAGAVS